TRFALPLVGIYSSYPAFSARANATRTLTDRINDCMQRSMNGRPLPPNGTEMQALVAYLKFLGDGSKAGDAPVGRGAPALALPTRAADPQRGATVFSNVCAACHQANGQGVKLQVGDRLIERRRYVFPPLWGPDSYNDAAGMANIVTGARFVHANMPIGITYEHPLLAVDDAMMSWRTSTRSRGLARAGWRMTTRIAGGSRSARSFRRGSGRSARRRTGSVHGSPSSTGAR